MLFVEGVDCGGCGVGCGCWWLGCVVYVVVVG